MEDNVTGSLGSRVAAHSQPVEILDHGRVVRTTPEAIPGWQNEYVLRNLAPGSTVYAVLRFTPAGYVWGVVFTGLDDAKIIASGRHPDDTRLPWRK